MEFSVNTIQSLSWFAWFPFGVMQRDYSRKWVWLKRIDIERRYTGIGQWTGWYHPSDAEYFSVDCFHSYEWDLRHGGAA